MKAEENEHPGAGDPRNRHDGQQAAPNCAWPTSLFRRFDSLPGRMLGHYQVIEKIGEGAMGAVYQARDTKLDRFVALKVLPPIRSDAASIRRFRREAQCLSKLQHPNIVTVFNLEEEEDLLFLVMEFVPGCSLVEAVPTGGYPLEKALSYARQIASALAAAHAQGITHRDLKPANILVTPDDAVKVVDFGLAQIANPSVQEPKSEGTRDGIILGTADYMSPEQARGHSVDARADIFSFGVILYEMLTGERLFRRQSTVETLAAILKDPVAPPNPLPKAVNLILMRCLAKNANDRYPSAVELSLNLERAARDLFRGWHFPRWVRSRATVACLIVLLAGAGYHWLGHHVSAAEPNAAEQFDRALAAHRKANATGCFKDKTTPCDLKGAVSELKLSIADWSALLATHPRYVSALWNEALAEQGLCELLIRSQDWRGARTACDASIHHFGEALVPGKPYEDLPSRLPQEADVLFNRGLSHQLRAQLPDLSIEAKRAELSRAIADMDHVLNGGTRYADFMAKRRSEVQRIRAGVDRERAALPPQTAK